MSELKMEDVILDICCLKQFLKTPSVFEILAIFVWLETFGIPKAAFMVHSAADLYEIAKASDELRKTSKTIYFNRMGECGKITRIRADRLGSFFNVFPCRDTNSQRTALYL